MRDSLKGVSLVLLGVSTLLVSSAGAANLLTNPHFDLDPTHPANAWTAVGNGGLSHNLFQGNPAPPSARVDTTGDKGTESLTLQQCVAIVGGTPYDFSVGTTPCWTGRPLWLPRNSTSRSSATEAGW